MQKRTTISLNRDLYEDLVKESLAKFGDAKHISAVVNERLSLRKRDHSRFLEMAKRKKTHKLTEAEIENFRSELSQRLEN